MTVAAITPDEALAIESGSWFARRSAPLRADILGRRQVRRLTDGVAVTSRGAPAEQWCGVAKADFKQLGASRQRVNQELRSFERDGALRIEPTRLVVLPRSKLTALSER